MQRKPLSASARFPIDASQTLGGIEDSRVRTVVSLIQDECKRRFRLRHFAQAVNLTPEHLCRIFTRQMGIAPLKYLKLVRLQSARELLENSHLTVKQIMFAVGFSDESHFVRDFENQFGLPPVRYRESMAKLPHVVQAISISANESQESPTKVR